MLKTEILINDKKKSVPFTVKLNSIDGVIEPSKDSDTTSILLVNGHDYVIRKPYHEMLNTFENFNNQKIK